MEEEQGNGDRGWPDSQQRVIDWEIGLPGSKELIPLNKSLISLDLASAFGISLESSLCMLDVNRASRDTVSNIHRLATTNDPMGKEDEEEEEEADPFALQQADSSHEGRTVKRPRLVWTPQLHKRFVEVVANLGEKKAVPKKVMHMMNVEGLTRENVASHLQKYRIYLKRMQGMEGPSSPTSNHRFGPVPGECRKCT